MSTDQSTTSTTSPTPTGDKQHLHLVSNVVETAISNEKVVYATSFLTSAYGAISRTSKAVLPSAITSKIESVEGYISTIDKDNLVHVLDDKVDSVCAFGQEVIHAQKEHQLTNLLTDKVLTVVEDLVATDEKQPQEESAEGADVPSQSPTVLSPSSRLAHIKGNVGKKVVKTAAQLKERTTAAASDFMDHQVKPQVDYVSALPHAVADKINNTTQVYSGKVFDGAQVAYTEFQSRVVDVASEVIAKENTDTKEKTFLLVDALAQQVRFAWNDFFVVPLCSYFSLPDLKPSTLYSSTVNSERYASVTNQVHNVSSSLKDKVEYVKCLPYEVASAVMARVDSVVGKEGMVHSMITFVGDALSQVHKKVAMYLPTNVTSYKHVMEHQD